MKNEKIGISFEREKALIKIIQDGNDEDGSAFGELFNAHKNFIYSLCYASNIQPWSGSSYYKDLQQVACIAYSKAIKNYDLSSQNRLLTFAVKFIKGDIYKDLKQNDRTIRIPSHHYVLKNKIRNAIEVLTPKLGREPEICEIAESTGLTPEQIEKNMDVFKNSYVININDENQNSIEKEAQLNDNVDHEKEIIDNCLAEELKEITDRLLNDQQKLILKLMLDNCDNKIICNITGLQSKYVSITKCEIKKILRESEEVKSFYIRNYQNNK